MRFHRLVVRDFKGIGETPALVFPETGVLVVEGPNEAGKSSLMEAIDLLFEYKDSSSHRRVLEAHPIGRDEAPFVELEMTSGPYRFVYAKRWARKGDGSSRGRGGQTTLRVLEPYERAFTGAEAAAKATEILDETLDRPLWEALRLMQATTLSPVTLSGSSQLRAALDAAAGAGGTSDASGDDGESVLAAAEAEYRRYHTPTTGKPTGDYDKALRAVGTARADAQAAERAVAEVEGHVARHASVSAEIEQAATRLADARAKRDELAVQRQEAERLRGLLATADDALGRARRAESDASTALAARQAMVAEVEQRTVACDEADAQVTELNLAVELAVTEAERAHEALVEAADEADSSRKALDEAREQLERAAWRAEHARLAERLARVDELSQQIAAVKATLASMRVGEQERKRVESAERALDRALVAQRSASATVQASPLASDVNVVVDGELRALQADRSWALTETMTLEVPGVVRVRLVPEAGASDRAAEVESARQALTSLLGALGVADPAQAYAQADARREAEASRAQLEAARTGVLGGDDLGVLRDRFGELEQLVTSIADLEPGTGSAGSAADETGETGELDESDAAVEISPARRAELEAAEAESRARLGRAREIADKARADVDRRRLKAAAAEADAKASRRELTSRVQALAAARETVGDDDLRGRLTDAAASLALALRERDELAGQVEIAVGHQLFEAAERAATAAAERLRQAETELNRIEAVLDEVGGQGRAERLDHAATALEAAERAAADITRHAEAARVLFETLRRHSDAAKAAYVAPFTAAVERLGRLVYGSSFGVVVAPDLTIEERALDGVHVPYGSLSTGAKEQLAILVRLACAQLVDPAEGVPVVIDDALGYSDPDRILATSAAFEHVGEHAQVVMLTCTPGRYDGVRGAATVSLAQ
ncbi:MAG: AAA family ATPase [Dermatophilus congolensis]|nr:AAA family ATPase [Dermatophilus congolensis]